MITFLLLSLTFVLEASAQNQAASRSPIEMTIEEYAVKAFVFTRSSGSLILSGTCKTAMGEEVIATDPVRIPEPVPSEEIGGLLGALSKASPHVTWFRTDDGLLHVQDDNSAATILKLHISRIEIRNAVSLRDAVQQLLSSPEVRTFVSANQIQLQASLAYAVSASKEADYLRTQARVFKYTQVFKDVNIEDILNGIVQVFPGVWIYSECPGRISLIADPTGSTPSQN